MRSILNEYLFVNAGKVSQEVAKEIVVLLRGLRDDSPQWMKVIDGISYFTKIMVLFVIHFLTSQETVQSLMSNLKNLQKSVMTATQFAQIMHFWMVLSALWVVGGDQKFVEMLNDRKNNGDNTVATKFCDNHEDGVTEAAYPITLI